MLRSQSGAFYMPRQPYMAAHMSADLPSCGDHNRVSCGGEAGSNRCKGGTRGRRLGESGGERWGAERGRGGWDYRAARTPSVASMSTSACSTGARRSVNRGGVRERVD